MDQPTENNSASGCGSVELTSVVKVVAVDQLTETASVDVMQSS